MENKIFRNSLTVLGILYLLFCIVFTIYSGAKDQTNWFLIISVMIGCMLILIIGVITILTIAGLLGQLVLFIFQIKD